ncbi:MAG: hypothetical protein ACI8RD_002200 [Bacillariaceae sp.]|jgi:hypothetical protein
MIYSTRSTKQLTQQIYDSDGTILLGWAGKTADKLSRHMHRGIKSILSSHTHTHTHTLEQTNVPLF